MVRFPKGFRLYMVIKVGNRVSEKSAWRSVHRTGAYTVETPDLWHTTIYILLDSGMNLKIAIIYIID